MGKLCYIKRYINFQKLPTAVPQKGLKCQIYYLLLEMADQIKNCIDFSYHYVGQQCTFSDKGIIYKNDPLSFHVWQQIQKSLRIKRPLEGIMQFGVGNYVGYTGFIKNYRGDKR